MTDPTPWREWHEFSPINGFQWRWTNIGIYPAIQLKDPLDDRRDLVQPVLYKCEQAIENMRKQCVEAEKERKMRGAYT